MAESSVIDLNADVGERPGALADDRRILQSISSANIACGFHAGTEATMTAMCGEAALLGVAVGAHVSYLDHEGFGRRELDPEPELLSAQVAEQIQTLRSVARSVGTDVRYVKAHGALYNRCARDPLQAAAVAAGIASTSAALLPVLCLPDSVMAAVAQAHGIVAVAEGFGDRAYRADGSLAPRGTDGAVLNAIEATTQALAFATGQQITAIDGTPLSLMVRSLCLHSDTPGASELAVAIRTALTGSEIQVQAFA